MISYVFYCKFETTTTFLKSPFNLSSAKSQFDFSKRAMKNKDVRNIRGSNLARGLARSENVSKCTSNGAHRSPRCPAVTKHPIT